MVDLNQSHRLVAVMAANWRSPRWTREELRVWVTALSDLDYERTRLAVQRALASHAMRPVLQELVEEVAG